MPRPDPLLALTRLLDFETPTISRLIQSEGWIDLQEHHRIGAVYDFVRNKIPFGYNRADNLPASQVLADGFGQCNTKATLLMALLRGVGIRCRFHGFTIHKALQRGVVPELIYPIAPEEILHSWVEFETEGGWVNLEGFILDQRFLGSLQKRFEGSDSLCGYGAGTECLTTPPVNWQGRDTYIQKTGIVQDFGTFNSPDDFFIDRMQAFGTVRGFLYRHVIRHWMNARVRAIRSGRVPSIPGADNPSHSHVDNARAEKT